MTTTATSAERHWLHEVCDKNAVREVTAHPWVVDVGGELWTVGCDGRVGVYLRGAVPGLPAADAETTESYRGFLAKAAKEPAYEVGFAALRAWVGAEDLPKDEVCGSCMGRLRVRCEECGGDGRCSECGASRHCTGCDGDGKVECGDCVDGKVKVDPGRREGLLFGRPVNRNLLARALARLQAESVTVFTGYDGILLIRAADWQVVVSPLNGGDVAADWPCFPEEGARP